MIRQHLGILKGALSIREGIDRPNLFYGVRPIMGTGMIGEKDLDFLIPKPPTPTLSGEDTPPYDYSKIPQTIIYVNHKLVGHAVAAQVRSLLPSATNKRPQLGHIPAWDWDPRSPAEKVVAVYHATISSTMRHYIQRDWRDGTTRILIASSAWGMGIDDKTVERVIQWRVKGLDNLDTLYQRFGRCARDPSMQGVCILFTEKEWIGGRPDTSNQARDRRGTDGEPLGSSAEIRRGNLENGLYRFINCPGTTKCRRKIILGFYADSQYHASSPDTCCDLCGADKMFIDRLVPNVFSAVFQFIVPGVPMVQFPKPSPALRQAVRTALLSLCALILKRDYSHRTRLLTALHILSPSQIESLAAHCRGITHQNKILSIPGFTIATERFLQHGSILLSFP